MGFRTTRPDHPGRVSVIIVLTQKITRRHNYIGVFALMQ